MNSIRFFKITILALVLLNIGTISFLWLGAAKQKGGHIEHPMSPADFLTTQLHLTREQSLLYEQMHHQHHRQVEQIKETAMPYREKLIALLRISSADTADIIQLTDSIARSQQKIELVTYYHFLALRNICTPTQQQAFDAVIDKALRMMSPKGPAPGEHM